VLSVCFLLIIGVYWGACRLYDAQFVVIFEVDAPAHVIYSTQPTLNKIGRIFRPVENQLELDGFFKVFAFNIVAIVIAPTWRPPFLPTLLHPK
jgi:hypothetical membrane protein